MSRKLTAVGATIALLAIVTLAVTAAAPGAGQPRYLNSHASVKDRVKDLLDRMTLEEKVGQMDQIVIGELRDRTAPANGDCNNTGGNSDPLQTSCLLIRAIEEAAVSHRRIDSQRHRYQERQRQREDCQQQRIGDHRPDAIGHRQPVVERNPQIAVSEIAQPPHVALRPGLVQPELALQLDSRLGTDLGVVTQPRHRTPRNEVDQRERQKRDPED